MGGIKSPSLNSLSRTLWEWCIEKNIIISAQPFAGKENLVAESLSREFSSNLEWSVDIDIFNQITNMTFVPDIDLFSSRLKGALSRYFSVILKCHNMSLHQWKHKNNNAVLLPRTLSLHRNHLLLPIT